MHRFFYPHFKDAPFPLHACFGASLLGSLLGVGLAVMVPSLALSGCVSGLALPAKPAVVCLIVSLGFPLLLWATELFPARRLWILLLTAIQSMGLCFCVCGCTLCGGVPGLFLGLRLFWPNLAAQVLCCHYAMGIYNGTAGRCFSDAVVVGTGCCVFFFLACFLNQII